MWKWLLGSLLAYIFIEPLSQPRDRKEPGAFSRWLADRRAWRDYRATANEARRRRELGY